MTRRVPRSEARPPRRLAGQLKPGAMGAAAVAWEIVRVFNAQVIRYRVKGDQVFSVDVIPMGPDTDPDWTGSLATLPGTQYTTGGKLAQAQVANTEGKIDMTALVAPPDLAGEAYHLVKITWGGTPGNLLYVDVSQLAPAGNA
jgi:hypothetical protein